jgi:hypothetical protein
MRLTAKITPYSSTVGGGLQLCGPDGRTRFMVMFCGITDGITKEETAALSEQFQHYVNNHDVVIQDRPQST